MHALNAAVFFVTGGTLANIVGIGSCLRPHEAVIAADAGHIVVHQAGAIEATGHKIIAVKSLNGKLTSESILEALNENSLSPHMAKPRLVYISNATEVGSVCTKVELHSIADVCQRYSLLLFLDDARLGVALAAEKNDLTMKDLGQLTDIFWIGGTKVGALLGEAIVVNNPALQHDFRFYIKQRGGLLANGQALGLQFQELFRSELFLELSRKANHIAKILSIAIQQAGYNLAADTETNQVFAILPSTLIERLQGRLLLYVW